MTCTGKFWSVCQPNSVISWFSAGDWWISTLTCGICLVLEKYRVTGSYLVNYSADQAFAVFMIQEYFSSHPEAAKSSQKLIPFLWHASFLPSQMISSLDIFRPKLCMHSLLPPNSHTALSLISPTVLFENHRLRIPLLFRFIRPPVSSWLG